jgi:hypothetical protein
MATDDIRLLQGKYSHLLMSEIPNPTRDYPVARILVWTAIMTAAATFWFVVGMTALTWLRHS